jgi:hypothetical protein
MMIKEALPSGNRHEIHFTRRQACRTGREIANPRAHNCRWKARHAMAGEAYTVL